MISFSLDHLRGPPYCRLCNLADPRVRPSISKKCGLPLACIWCPQLRNAPQRHDRYAVLCPIAENSASPSHSFCDCGMQSLRRHCEPFPIRFWKIREPIEDGYTTQDHRHRSTRTVDLRSWAG